jgi:hypothetical protein
LIRSETGRSLYAARLMIRRSLSEGTGSGDRADSVARGSQNDPPKRPRARGARHARSDHELGHARAPAAATRSRGVLKDWFSSSGRPSRRRRGEVEVVRDRRAATRSPSEPTASPMRRQRAHESWLNVISVRVRRERCERTRRPSPQTLRAGGWSGLFGRTKSGWAGSQAVRNPGRIVLTEPNLGLERGRRLGSEARRERSSEEWRRNGRRV